MTATKEATGAKLDVAKGAEIKTVNAAAENTAITGEGKVESANVTADNVKVDTAGTKTSVSDGVTGTTAGDKPVSGGTTTTTPGTTPSTPSGSGGGGGGGGGTTSYSYKVSIATFTGGTVTVNTTQTNTANTEVTLTVTPAEGYKLKALTVKRGETEVAVTNNKFTMDIAGTYTVTAEFIPVTPTPGDEQVAGVDANTISFTADGELTFTMPESTDAKGIKVSLYSATDEETPAFFIELNNYTPGTWTHHMAELAILLYGQTSSVSITKVSVTVLASEASGKENAVTEKAVNYTVSTGGEAISPSASSINSDGYHVIDGVESGSKYFLLYEDSEGSAVLSQVISADNTSYTHNIDMSTDYPTATKFTIQKISSASATAVVVTPKQSSAIPITTATEEPDANYTVTFNANGGSVDPTTGTTGTDGKLSSLPTPTKDNFTFDGWFTAAEAGDAISTDTVFSADATIFAHWTENAPTTFTVTFNANYDGADPATSVQTDVPNDTATALTENTFTRDGYSFAGWATTAEGEKAYDDKGNVTLTTDLELFAKWTPAFISMADNSIAIAAKEENDPYPLLKFSYNRLVAGATVELKVNGGDQSTVYFYEGQTFDGANENAYFTWSLRDLSSLGYAETGYTKSGADAVSVERANDNIIAKGTVLGYTLTATKDDVTQTIEGTYTVTEDDVAAVSWPVTQLTATVSTSAAPGVDGIISDEPHHLTIGENATELTQNQVSAMLDGESNASFVEYITLTDVPEFTSIKRTIAKSDNITGTETIILSEGKLSGEEGRYVVSNTTTYLKLGTYFATKTDDVWAKIGDGDYTETLIFINGTTPVATCTYTIGMSKVTIAPPSFTVSFNTDGGTGTADEQTVVSGEKVTKPDSITKDGYTLEGWYNGETEWSFDTDTVSSDITLTAKWAPAFISMAENSIAIAAKEENDPYPLLKFSYNRLVAGATVELKVNGGDQSTVYFYEGQTFDGANENAYFTWSLRDLSSLGYAETGYTKSGADAVSVERANDNIIAKGTVLGYTLTATKDDVTQTIEGTYTVKQTNCDSVFYVPALLDLCGNDSITASVAMADANTYNITLAGTADTQIPSCLESLFVTSQFSEDADNYTVITLKGVLPVGSVTVKQENNALNLYATKEDNITQPSGGVWTKEKTYTISERADDYSFLLFNKAETDDDIVITVTIGETATTFNIINNVSISAKTV